MANTPELFDVLVVGAGPVGLFFATQMASYGHSFRIIEKALEPSPLSKALALMPRTLEILENCSHIDAFLENKGTTLNGFIARSPENNDLFRVNFTQLDSRYSFVLGIAQNVTERVLHERLTALSGSDKVERGVELLGYEQIKVEGEEFDRIVARVLKNGKEEKIHAKFIVGCDGVHSKVRKNYSDWAYEGATVKDEFGFLDCKVRDLKAAGLDEHWGSGYLSSEGMTGFIPFDEKNGIWRIFFPLGSYTYTKGDEVTHGVQMPSKDFTFEDIKALLDKRLGGQCLEIFDPIWVTKFHINERMVRNYRRGSAFLAGDAAHCHSPMGGQGLNTGIQDAFNLAWKINSVLENLTDDPNLLLNSYSQEREPVAREVLNKTSGGATLLMRSEWPFNFIRNVIVPWVMGLNHINGIISKNLSGKYIQYPQSSAILPSSGNGWVAAVFGGGNLIKSGTVAPDGLLDDDNTPFYHIIRHMREHRLVLFTEAAGPESIATQTLLRLSRRFSLSLKPIIITPNEKEPFQTAYPGVSVYVDRDQVLHQRFGVYKNHPALILIRPDMVVAAATGVSENEIKVLEDFMSGYLAAKE